MASKDLRKKHKAAGVRFEDCVRGITSCQHGQERNMYPYIRDLFVHFLDFRAEDVFTDTATEQGGIPDLAVKVPTGLLDAKGKEIKSRWLVLEAKDEPGVFLDETSRREIFAEKSKYIDLDTVWFVMVDPQCLVLRAVSTRSACYDSTFDIVIQWAGLSAAEFLSRCIEITAAHAGVNRRLKAFREDQGHPIAEIKLSCAGKLLSAREEENLDRARNEFYLAMRSSAQLLQNSCRRAMEGIVKEAMEIKKLLEDFRQKYGIRELHLSPFRLAGEEDKISTRELFKQHLKDVHALAKAVNRNATVARFGCFTLPEYLERTGQDHDKALDLLAAETASLLMARCMMLRFFEDFGFFGEKKYLCNGGIKAFQQTRQYYGTSYGRMIRYTYEEGSKVHASLFSQHELDWVLDSPDPGLSNAIERALFYLSHFDFATIDQDVLSNIYGQFMDTSQRKRLGEHYTPPDIARYIVRQLGLQKGDKVIDPACGLGTFLIEALNVLVGEAAGKGVADYRDATEALANVRGNDLNAFSAMIAQIQMMWHLFVFRDEIKRKGFPETAITGGHNSLRHQQLTGSLFDAHLTDFSLLDLPEYAAVVGNPPYVRPERQESALSREDAAYFDTEVSANIDLYSLFLYKAMEGWCRSPNGDHRPGKLGFVLPISFCDNDDNKALRQFFAPGGRWTIREIVDLELIGPLVFSADVAPIILIAEKRPPTPQDKIRLRVADERCARFTGLDQKHIKFDLNQATLVEMPYADVFTADGRILTKITPERKRILDHFAGPTFSDIAQTFWVGKSKNTIVAWAMEKPKHDERNLRWEMTDMIRMGAAFRGQIHQSDQDGKDVFKGENIVACRMEGAPVRQSIDVNQMDDSSLWKFANLLPENGFAFHQIATALTCAPFKAKECVILNTASLFFPKKQLIGFPFDFLVLSRLYQYFFALSQREAILFRARCHVYPSTIRRLPWSDKLPSQTDKLIQLREQFLAACENLHRREEVLRQKLAERPHTTLKQLVVEAARAKVEWSEDLLAGKAVKIGEPIIQARDGLFMIQPGDDLLDWIAINNETIARCFFEGLALHANESLSRTAMFEILLPTPAALTEWQQIVAEFDQTNYEQSLAGILDKLDAIVAKSFGIPAKDVAFIKAEFKEDPMLRRVRPNLPFAPRRLKGLRKGLAESDRYQKAYKTRG